MPHYIYGLVDPFTDEIRYIGQSTSPWSRLKTHLNERNNTHKCHWIQKCISMGKKPGLTIIEEVKQQNQWQERERYWISYAKKNNWNITNSTSGGDGVPDLPQETRERISKVWIGKKHKPESLIKIGQASKGRKHSEEYKGFMRRIMTGRIFTDPWKKKISQANRKLSDEDITEIKNLFSQGIGTCEIAKRYNVDRTTISKVKMGRYL